MRGSMFTDGAPYQIGGINRDNIEYYSSYDFNLSWSRQNFPKINLDLHYGSDELRWDVSGLSYFCRNGRERSPPDQVGLQLSTTRFSRGGGMRAIGNTRPC